MDEVVCLAVAHGEFLAFCAQLAKQGCDIVSVNTFGVDASYVWLANSPLLQMQMGETSRGGLACAGFLVRAVADKPRGAQVTVLKNASYRDLLDACERRRPASWSPPTCVQANKYIFTEKPASCKKK